MILWRKDCDLVVGEKIAELGIYILSAIFLFITRGNFNLAQNIFRYREI